MSVKAAMLQAQRYGVQTALLGDAGKEHDRRQVRNAWMAFLRQFTTDSKSWNLVRKAYWRAYETA